MFRRFSLLASCLLAFVALPILTGQMAVHAATTEAAPASKPLLVIRFNQRNVYFDKALTQAVQKAEAAKPGVVYEVVSFSPMGPAGNQANANLSTVVNMIAGLGVPDSRIQVATELVDANLGQEVHVYVY